MRRLLPRLLAVAVVASGLVPVMAGASWACSCAPDPRPVAEQYRELARTAEVVYVADVVSREGGEGTDEPWEHRYDLQVVRSLKGGVDGTRSVTTSSQESACGVTLPVGSRVLVTSEPFGYCGGVTTQDVDALAAVVRDALSGVTTHRVQAGESWHDVARQALRSARGAEPTASQVVRTARALQRANRRVSRVALPEGVVLRVPALG